MYWLIFVGIFTYFIPSAEAAWPDSSKGRIYAQDVVRKDLKTPGNTFWGDERTAAYKKACDLKYYPACNYKTWTDEDGFSNPQKAGEFFSSRCKSDGLSCVVSGWSHGYVNGKPSNKALNPSKAFKDLTFGCTKKRYGPACAHLGELYMMGVGTNINYKKAHLLFKEACKARDQYGCYQEADLYYHGWGVTQDYTVAFEKYTEACEAGFLQACTKIGLMTEYGQGTAKNYSLAKRRYQNDCALGHNQACVRLANMAQFGRGTERDRKDADNYFEKACELQDKYGCYLGGDLFFDEWGENEDFNFANKQLNNGCKRGNVQACVELGNLLEQGRGVEADQKKAYQYYNGACEQNNSNGCFHLAKMQTQNIAVHDKKMTGFEHFKNLCDDGDSRGCEGMAHFLHEGKNQKGAFNLAKQACDSGNAAGCSFAGELLVKNSTISESLNGFDFMRQGCNMGDLHGCLLLGDIYFNGISRKDIQVKRDREKAREIFSDVCNQGVGLGCYQQAKSYDIESKREKALSYYEKACGNNHTHSCLIAVKRYQYGENIEKDVSKVLPYLQKNCKQNEKEACKWLGDLYAMGEGGENAYSYALEHYQKACELGSGAGCYQSGKLIQGKEQPDSDISNEAMRFFQKGCYLDNSSACAKSGTTLLRIKYEEILNQAFQSETCTVWIENENQPEKNKKFVSANQNVFTVHVGKFKEKEFTATHKETKYLGSSAQIAQSFWDVTGEEDSLQVEHHENWFHLRDSINSFPRENSLSRDKNAETSVYYSRDKNTLRRYERNSCDFIGGAAILKVDSCSELQALIASQLISECRQM